MQIDPWVGLSDNENGSQRNSCETAFLIGPGPVGVSAPVGSLYEIRFCVAREVGLNKRGKNLARGVVLNQRMNWHGVWC